MNNTYPIGTPLTFVWRFQTPDGKALVFDSSRHSFALRYTSGRGSKTIDAFALSADGDGLTWTLPAEQQTFLGAYDLVLDIFLQGKILEHYYFKHAFTLYKAAQNPINTEQYAEGVTINLLSIGEFYHFTPDDARLSALETELANFNVEFIRKIGEFTEEYIAKLDEFDAEFHDELDANNRKFQEDMSRFDRDLHNALEDYDHAVKQQIEKYKPIVVNGDVTNAPDEEDITSDENDLLKLKDRNSLYGKGYVILRRDKTFAEQVVHPNTIYEVRYDFDLDGASVTIPRNCMFKYMGGQIKNGTLITDDTVLDVLPSVIFSNIVKQGTWITPQTNVVVTIEPAESDDDTDYPDIQEWPEVLDIL